MGVKRLEEDLRAAKRRQAQQDKECTKLAADIAELELKNNTAIKHLKTTIKRKEELMVSHDCLKLEVKRLREGLNNRADEVFGLQNRKFQLEMSMQEREQEIQVHAEMLRGPHTAAEHERHAAAMQLKERLVKIERLQSKYEMICGRAPLGGEDADGGEHSQAYYVIRAAQEREELQREGDELDQKIQKTEKEIRALERTLQHLYDKNRNYKASFAPIDTTSAPFEQKLLLEEQYRAALSKYRSHRLEQSELEEDLSKMEGTLHQMSDEKSLLSNGLQHLQQTQQSHEQEISSHEQKAQRSQRQLEKLRAEHRRATGTNAEQLSMEEQDMQLVEVNHLNRSMLEELSNLAKQHPEIAGRLEQAMAEANIEPPSRPGSARSAASSHSSGSFRG